MSISTTKTIKTIASIGDGYEYITERRENGSLYAKYRTLNGKKDGRCRKFWDYSPEVMDGPLLLECTYKNDKLDGHQQVYYDNGAIQETMFFIDGKAYGTHRVYDPDGTITYSCDFDMDEPILETHSSVGPSIKIHRQFKLGIATLKEKINKLLEKCK